MEQILLEALILPLGVQLHLYLAFYLDLDHSFCKDLKLISFMNKVSQDLFLRTMEDTEDVASWVSVFFDEVGFHLKVSIMLLKNSWYPDTLQCLTFESGRESCALSNHVHRFSEDWTTSDSLFIVGIEAGSPPNLNFYTFQTCDRTKMRWWSPETFSWPILIFL